MQIAAVCVGIVGTVVAQELWELHEQPSLSVQYALTTTEARSERVGHEIRVTTILTDLKSGKVAARSTISASDSTLRLHIPRRAYTLKFAIRNAGRTSLTDLVITVFANFAGTVSLESTPNIHALLSSVARAPFQEHVDLITVPIVPRDAAGVITYTIEMDSAAFRPEYRGRKIMIDIPYWTSRQLGQQRFNAERVSFSRVVALEARMQPGGASLFSTAWNETGKQGLIKNDIQLVDPELRTALNSGNTQ